MTRRALLLLVPACAACTSRKKREAESLAPATIGQVWNRKEIGELPPSHAVAPMTPGTTARVIHAVYEGPGRIHISVYDLKSSAAALDAAQRWKAAANEVFFYKQNYFVVVKWDRAERAALSAFVRGLEKQLE